jgi:hypothetical protein
VCEKEKAPARKSLDSLGKLTDDIDAADLFSSRLGRRLKALKSNLNKVCLWSASRPCRWNSKEMEQTGIISKESNER